MHGYIWTVVSRLWCLGCGVRAVAHTTISPGSGAAMVDNHRKREDIWDNRKKQYKTMKTNHPEENQEKYKPLIFFCWARETQEKQRITGEAEEQDRHKRNWGEAEKTKEKHKRSRGEAEETKEKLLLCFSWVVIVSPLLLLCFSSEYPLLLLCLFCVSSASPVVLLCLCCFSSVSLVSLLLLLCFSSVLFGMSFLVLLSFSCVCPASPVLLLALLLLNRRITCFLVVWFILGVVCVFSFALWFRAVFLVSIGVLFVIINLCSRTAFVCWFPCVVS